FVGDPGGNCLNGSRNKLENLKSESLFSFDDTHKFAINRINL
ncbi:22400_t:CDS:1, partial [Gigaspora rosea]